MSLRAFRALAEGDEKAGCGYVLAFQGLFKVAVSPVITMTPEQDELTWVSRLRTWACAQTFRGPTICQASGLQRELAYSMHYFSNVN